MTPVLLQYQTLLATIDNWFAACQAAHPEAIACGAGCSACCRGLFDITLLDAGLLRAGLERLPAEVRAPVLLRARTRLEELQRLWPGFGEPYLLNLLPDELWTAMPEDDPTPCPLLGDDGRCLVYAWRPMTCRLHGLPQLDCDGTLWLEEWCTRNFVGIDPLQLPDLAWDLRSVFTREFQLQQAYSKVLCGEELTELDTFIPLALLMPFATFDWHNWIEIHRAHLTRHR